MGQLDTPPLAGFGANPAPSHSAAMVLHTAKGNMRLHPTWSISMAVWEHRLCRGYNDLSMGQWWAEVGQTTHRFAD